MVNGITIQQTRRFAKVVKKLKSNQKSDLDIAVKYLLENPEAGELKSGDLAYLRVYKFKMNKQLALLAYTFLDKELILYLMDLGSHENFYRDIKR